MKNNTKNLISYFIILIAIPAVTVGGAIVFKDKKYSWVSLCVVILSLAAFFLGFEKSETTTHRMILISVMTALSVVGRIAFAPIPGFKPVTAMVIITAMYFGKEAGFLTGALSALISNFYFGQGPWTPFQMFSWGIVGLIAGLISQRLKKSKISLLSYGALSGIIFSLLMDVWTVIWAQGTFNAGYYFAAVASAAYFTALYAVSNVVFLLILAKPIGKILERIQTKYGIY